MQQSDHTMEAEKTENELKITTNEEPKKKSRKKKNKKIETQQLSREDSGHNEPLAYASYEKYSQLLSSKKKRESCIFSLFNESELWANHNEHEKLGLLCACLEYGIFGLAEKILNSSINVNRDLDCKVPLCFAMRNTICTVNIVKMMIDAGFPADGIVDKRNNLTALHEAVKLGQIATVKYLLGLSINPNPKDNKGLTPLHYAAKGTLMDIIKVLVEHGADLDMTCDKNYPPLFYAMAALNYDSVKTLLSLGADFNKVWKSGEGSLAPIHFATGLCDLEMVIQLLNKGANPNAVIPETGQTTLHIALLDDNKPNARNNLNPLALMTPLLLSELVKFGADVNAKDKAGTSVLDLAIKLNYSNAVELFVENKLSLNTDEAFFKIMKTCDDIMIRMCLQYGADYLTKTKEGEFAINIILSPAFIARIITSGDTSIVHSQKGISDTLLSIMKLFWRSGFPVEYTLNNVEIPKKVTTGIMGLIKDRISVQKSLFQGVKKCNPRMIRNAIKSGADTRTRSVELPFPIHYLAGKQPASCLVLYLSSRCVSVNSLNEEGKTPLQVAALAGHVGCCKVLLEKGAVYNATTAKCPESPLQLAKSKRNDDVVKILERVALVFHSVRKEGKLRKLDHPKAMLNCRDRSGKTLLETALKHGKVAIAERIMKRRLKKRPL